MKILRTAGGLAQEYAVAVILIIVCTGLALGSPQFARWTNITNVLEQASLLGVVAMGVALLLVSGNFDLSVGGQAALVGVVTATFINSSGLVVGIIVGLVLGMILGTINGILVVYLKINSLMATLGTGSVLLGCALLYSNTAPVLLNDYALSDLVVTRFLGLSLPVWVFLGAILLTAWYLHFTVAGRETYAVGASITAARFAGVRVNAVRFIPFVITGVFTAVASIMLVGQVAAGLPDAALTWALQVITAVVLGGISIHGGRGTVVMAVFGILLIAVANNGFNLLGLPGALQQVFTGSILVIAVGVDEWLRQARLRRERSRSIRIDSEQLRSLEDESSSDLTDDDRQNQEEGAVRL